MSFDISTMTSKEIGENVRRVMLREKRLINLKEMAGILGMVPATLRRAIEGIEGITLTNHLYEYLFVFIDEEEELK